MLFCFWSCLKIISGGLWVENCLKIQLVRKDSEENRMQVIKSKLNVRSDEYRSNREEMLNELDFIATLHSEAAQGGGKEAMERLRSRNKLPLRQRISLVLDRDSPFFEVSPLAAYNSHVKTGSGFSKERNFGRTRISGLAI